MGLLDQWEALKGYVQANTPRNTRPAVSPAKVFNEGLLNPNPYNAVAANRFKDSAFGLLGIVPGLGDASSAVESADLFKRGENFAGGMAALGALPLVPAIGGIFVGKGAKTWDFLKAQQADELLKQGVDPREVWKQTGTLKGVDGALRQEIPDNLAAMRGADPTEEIANAFREGGMDAMNARRQELAGYVRPYQRGNVQEIDNVLEHGQLGDAYPDLYHYGKYQYDAANPRIGEGAYYSEKPGSEFATDFIKISPANEPTARSTTLHELQHAIQQREGWARGGSPEQMAVEWSQAKQKQDFYSTIDALARTAEQDFGGNVDEAVKNLNEFGFEVTPEHVQELMRIGTSKAAKLSAEAQNTLKQYGGGGQYGDAGHNLYKRLAGEAEARLTQSRMGLDAAQRLEHYPYDMGQYGLDVPMDQLIVRGLLGQ